MHDANLKIPRRCVHCEHWKGDDFEQSNAEIQIGTCRESPPHVVVRQGEALAVYPHTTALDWCGRWKLRVDA